MAAVVFKEATKPVSHQQSEKVEFVKCECCGFSQECTQAYITRVKERYEGRWICGLCAEAVKDESCRYKKDVTMTIDEALKQHMKFCQQFRSSTPPRNPTEELISAMKHLLRRSLDSPRKKNGDSVFPSSASSLSIES